MAGRGIWGLTKVAAKATPYIGGALGVASLAGRERRADGTKQDFFGEESLMDSRAFDYASAIGSGAMIGSMFGPLGTVIGGGLGALTAVVSDYGSDVSGFVSGAWNWMTGTEEADNDKVARMAEEITKNMELEKAVKDGMSDSKFGQLSFMDTLRGYVNDAARVATGGGGSSGYYYTDSQGNSVVVGGASASGTYAPQTGVGGVPAPNSAYQQDYPAGTTFYTDSQGNTVGLSPTGEVLTKPSAPSGGGPRRATGIGDGSYAGKDARGVPVFAGTLEDRIINALMYSEGTDRERALKRGYKDGVGGDAQYNVTLADGKFLNGAKPDITDMSLDEIRVLQNQMLAHPDNHYNSSAVGAPQVVGDTLDRIKKRLKLSGDTKFNKPTQLLVYRELLKDAGIEDYKAGRIDAALFQNRLSEIWASIAPMDDRVRRYLPGRKKMAAKDFLNNVILQPETPSGAPAGLPPAFQPSFTYEPTNPYQPAKDYNPYKLAVDPKVSTGPTIATPSSSNYLPTPYANTGYQPSNTPSSTKSYSTSSQSPYYSATPVISTPQVPTFESARNYSGYLPGEQPKTITDKPTVIIAHTIPGKGIKEIEGDYKWHGTPPNAEQEKKWLTELRTLQGKIEASHND
jgi:hypothetical protein